MTYRVRRKFTSTTFRLGDQICKIFLDPLHEMKDYKGYWFWMGGFAIGKSNRQLNDWFRDRNNKRTRSIQNKITGRAGMKAIRRGFEGILRLRWNIEPGDCLSLDCTSGDPDRQFRAWSRWHRYHPEWVIDYDRKEFYWYRPPYSTDPIRKSFNIIPFTPEDPLANTAAERYADSFHIHPKGSNSHLSNQQIADLLAQVLTM